MPTDAELLRRYAETRSEAAFAELVRRHLPFVYGAALRQLGGARHRAEEVAQTVFIALARKAGALAPRTELAGWLHTGTHFAAAKLKRGEQRRQQREQQAVIMQQVSGTGNSATDWDLLRPVLDDALQALAESDRTVLLLRFFADRRHAEIGRELGLGEDAARMRVERALDRLRVVLARRGLTSTSAALGAALAAQPAVAVPATLAASITGAVAGLGIGLPLPFLAMKITSAFLPAAAVLGVALGVYGLDSARRTRADAAVSASRQTTLQAHLAELETRTAAAEAEAVRLQQQLRAARPLAAAAPFSGPVSRPAGTGGGTLTLRQMTPEQARAATDRNTDATYGALCRQLGWHEAQREPFRTLVAEHKAAGERLFKTAVAQTRAANPQLDRAGTYEIFEATNAQVHREQQAEVRLKFGEAAASTLARYQETLALRLLANQLATALFQSETPLSPMQSDQLVELLARHTPGSAGRLELTALDVPAATAAARREGLLNSAQTLELERLAAQLQDQARADRERNTAPSASPPAAKP